MSMDFIQDEVLPQQPKVLGPQLRPTVVVTDKARIEPIDLWGGNNFGRTIRTMRTDDVRYKGRFQHRQIVGDRGAAHFTELGKSCCLENSPALRHQELDEFLQRMPALDAEKLSYIFCPVGIHPLLEISLGQLFGQKEWRKPSPEKAVIEVQASEIFQVRGDHRREPDLFLTAGQGIAKFSRRPESRGAGGEDPSLRIMIGGDLQDLRWISKPVNLIQNNSATTQALEKPLRVLDHPAHTRKFAVKILDVRQTLRQDGLSRPPHPGEPNDGAPLPCLFDLFAPKSPLYHTPGM